MWAYAAGMATALRFRPAASRALLPCFALALSACEPPLPPLTPPSIPAAALPPAESAAPPPGGFGAPQKPPSAVEGEVAQAESLGAQLFTHALFTRKAENALVEARLIPAGSHPPGWVVIERGEGGVAYLVSDEGGAPRVLYRVAIADRGGDELHVETAPPKVPDDSVAAAYLARKTVMRDWTPVVPNEYRSFVLPAPVDRPGFFVYLIAEPRGPNEMMVGGHQRFRISADGLTVLERFAFSKTNLALPIAPTEGSSGAVLAGVWMTHLTTDTPVETHVYLSLLHRLPLQVGTRLGIWEVQGGTITVLGPMSGR